MPAQRTRAREVVQSVEPYIVAIVERGDNEKEPGASALLQRVKDVLVRHPGDRPVTLTVQTMHGGTALLCPPMRVSGSAAMEVELRAVLGN